MTTPAASGRTHAAIATKSYTTDGATDIDLTLEINGVPRLPSRVELLSAGDYDVSYTVKDDRFGGSALTDTLTCTGERTVDAAIRIIESSTASGLNLTAYYH